MLKNNINLEETRLRFMVYFGRVDFITSQYLSVLLGSRHFLALILSSFTSNFNINSDDHPFALPDMLRFLIQMVQLRPQYDEALEAKYPEKVEEVITEYTSKGQVTSRIWKEYDPYFPYQLFRTDSLAAGYQDYLISIKHHTTDSLPIPPPLTPPTANIDNSALLNEPLLFDIAFATLYSFSIISGQQLVETDNTPIHQLFKRYTPSDQCIIDLVLEMLSSNRHKEKRDLIDSILANLLKFDPDFNIYLATKGLDRDIKSAEQEEKDRLLKARALAHQKAIKEKMIQQQKMVQIDDDLSDDEEETLASKPVHTCVVCHEGSKAGDPLGAIARMEFSFLKVLSLVTNLTPNIARLRPDYIKELGIYGHKLHIKKDTKVTAGHGLRMFNESAGLVIRSCKHLIHKTCLNIDSTTDTAFACPLCNRFSSILLAIDSSPELVTPLFLSLTNLYTQGDRWTDINMDNSMYMWRHVLSNIDVLELSSRISMLPPDPALFYVYEEAEFQGQLTTLRMVYYNTMAMRKSMNVESLSDMDLFENFLKVDPLHCASFMHYLDPRLDTATLIERAYERALFFIIGAIFDESGQHLSDPKDGLRTVDNVYLFFFSLKVGELSLDECQEFLNKLDIALAPILRRLYLFHYCLTTSGSSPLDAPASTLSLADFSNIPSLRQSMGLRTPRDTIVSPNHKDLGTQFDLIQSQLYIPYLRPQFIKLAVLPDQFIQFFLYIGVVCLDKECKMHTMAHIDKCQGNLGIFLGVMVPKVYVIRNTWVVAIENIYFDKINNPATYPKQNLKLSMSAYRQVYSNWIKGAYHDKLEIIHQ
eukprot:gene17343-20690_t